MDLGQKLKQPDVGVQRQLSDADREHIVCLLRVIEHLPELTKNIDMCGESEESINILKENVLVIHKNHIQLSQLASLFLDREDESS